MMCYVIDWGREGVEGACIFAASGSDVADSVITCVQCVPTRVQEVQKTKKSQYRTVNNKANTELVLSTYTSSLLQYRTRPKYLCEFVIGIPIRPGLR